MNHLTAATLFSVLLTAAPATAQIGDDEVTYDVRVKEALDAVGLNYEIDEDNDFKLVIEFDDDRSHVVYVSSETYRLEDLEIREVWSVGHLQKMPFDRQLGEDFLLRSAQVRLGGWELQQWGDDYVAIFRAQMSAQSTGDALYTAISAVAATADEVEEELVGTDEL
ncbi:hypothetical protein [Pseudidiomarina atlantica]|uniref:hypothetical protein n=1 Tax=Pseudidiomarina atlantica TaxID=1517416 RepID=UPI000689D0C3|nr:hypothetical protein [Pseudidiomarina atlantica]